MRQGVTALTLVAALSACAHKPRDADMIERFNAHKAEFQALANEALADIRNVRQDQYRKRLAALGLRDVSGVPHPSGTLLFTVASAGTASRGSRVDFVYSRGEPSPVVESFDSDAAKSHGHAYRRIDDHWYLYLTRD